MYVHVCVELSLVVWLHCMFLNYLAQFTYVHVRTSILRTRIFFNRFLICQMFICLCVCLSVCAQAGFERDEAALQKRVDALIMEIASFEQTVKLRTRQKVGGFEWVWVYVHTYECTYVHACMDVHMYIRLYVRTNGCRFTCMVCCGCAMKFCLLCLHFVSLQAVSGNWT